MLFFLPLPGILIDDALCEGYGFKILDCSPFELAPNASKKIEISFAPDFTLARVTHTLYFDTDIGPLPTSINFSLVGTIPPHSLEPCIAAVVRPTWEAKLKNVAVGVLTLVFVLVIIVAYFDSDRILKEHIVNMSKDKGPIQPALDLRQIGLQQSSGGTPVAVATTPNTVDAKKAADSASKHQQNGQTFSTKSRKIGKKLPYNGTNAVSGSPAAAVAQPTTSHSSVIKTSWAEFTNKLTRTKTPPATNVADASSSPSPTPSSSSSASKSTQSTNKPQTNRDKQPVALVATSSPPSHQTSSAVKGSGGRSNSNNQKPKEKIIEEDTLSTSTESSSNSSEDSVSEKSTKNDKLDHSGGGSSAKKGAAVKLNLSLEEQQTLRTTVGGGGATKLNLKKTKSLPLAGFDVTAPVKESPVVNGQPKNEKPLNVSLGKTVSKVVNGALNGQHNGVNENVQDNKVRVVLKWL
jgi:Transmembrane protein 131-like